MSLKVEEQLGTMSMYATKSDYEVARKRMVREGYEQVIKGLARMINAIPTSDLRNVVTDLNIMALELQTFIEEEIK